MYLLIMALMDPNFSLARTLTKEEVISVKILCQEHLTKQDRVYADLTQLSK